MPVHKITKNGKVVGYQYGDKGAKYLISQLGKAGAAKKAYAQGAAIEHSQEKQGETPDTK
jgi:hypothetical protein